MKKSARNRLACVVALILGGALLVAKPVVKHEVSMHRAAENVNTTQKTELSVEKSNFAEYVQDVSQGEVLAEYVYYDDNGEVVLVETYRSVPSSVETD